jgi:D-alanyl-D-alanine carboxypeptidase
MVEKEKKLQSVLNNTIDEKKIFGSSFGIKKDGQTWYGASGNISIDQPYFIASTSKLFTTAIILRLQSDGILHLSDTIDRYIDTSILTNLHVLNGVNYTKSITIQHLLSHTSGIPDYFQDKGKQGESLEKLLVSGKDQYWTAEQAIERSKAIKPLFPPGKEGKAHYSDTNFQLLGKIIETSTNKSYADNITDSILKPLHLSHTYLYSHEEDKNPQTLYYKTKELHIPKAMTSFGADGGVVSTTADMLTFIEAFFTGKLFPINYIGNLQQWNSIFFPMQSGIGIHLFKLPWFFNPTGSIPSFIGHSGLSGALAYYCPKENIYVVGTVNQVAHPEISFKTMIKLVQVIQKTTHFHTHE